MSEKRGRIIGVGVPVDQAGRHNTIAGDNATRLSFMPSDGKANTFATKAVKRINLDLATARTRQKIKISGTTVWIADASSTTAIADVTLHELSNDAIPMKAGSAISGVPFDKIWISNSAQPGESMAIIIIKELPNDRISLE